MSLWLRSGSLAYGTVGGQVQLMPYWKYEKADSTCPPLPAFISLIGCDPPECITFTNTNLSPYPRVYARISCGDSAVGPAYVWDDHGAGCGWPSGINIEEAEACDVIRLKLSSGSPGFNFFPDGDWDVGAYCEFWDGGAGGYDYVPYVATGACTLRGPWGWGMKDCYAMYWNCGLGCGGVSVDCDGNVDFAGVGSIQNGQISFYGTGTPIELDDDGLPIGVSVIEVWRSWYVEIVWPPGEEEQQIIHDPEYYADLTVIIDKV